MCVWHTVEPLDRHNGRRPSQDQAHVHTRPACQPPARCGVGQPEQQCGRQKMQSYPARHGKQRSQRQWLCQVEFRVGSPLPPRERAAAASAAPSLQRLLSEEDEAGHDRLDDEERVLLDGDVADGCADAVCAVPPAPHKDFSELYEGMSGKGESASEAHQTWFATR